MIEYGRLAEDIAILGQPLLPNAWQHLVNYQVDILARPAAILIRDFVGA